MIILSIIVPTYNERGNVSPLVLSLSKILNNVDYEIIFVDDNSPDGTASAIRKLSEFDKSIKLIERKGKLGLASAVVTGTKTAKGEWVLVMDGDLSHPPETAKRMFNLREKFDLIIASRNTNGSGKHSFSAHRNLISKGAEFLCRPFVGDRTTDPLSGFFLIKRDIFNKTSIRVKGYKILLNLIYDNPNLRIRDIPYTFVARHSGKTKLDSIEIINYLFDLVRLWK